MCHAELANPPIESKESRSYGLDPGSILVQPRGEVFHFVSQPDSVVAMLDEVGQKLPSGLTQGRLASSAWHIDQMGQPPRLGCLGMCTGQCAVVDVNSKCWRNMFVLVCLHTRQDR